MSLLRLSLIGPWDGSAQGFSERTTGMLSLANIVLYKTPVFYLFLLLLRKRVVILWLSMNPLAEIQKLNAAIPFAPTPFLQCISLVSSLLLVIE